MSTTARDTGIRPYHHGNLREALIAAGLAILEDGEVPLTLRAAAKAVGVSHTAPYSHFTDKNALLAAIAIRGFKELRDETEEARRNAGPDAGDQLVATGLAYILFGAEHPALYRLMFGERPAEASPEEVRAAGQNAFDVLVSVMADGIASGAFCAADARAAAFTSWALVHGMTQMALDRTGPLTAKDREGIEARLHASHEIMMNGLKSR